MEERSNEELAVLAQSGDEYAFERLWKQTEAFVVSEIKKLKEDYNFNIWKHMWDLKLCGKVGIAQGVQPTESPYMEFFKQKATMLPSSQATAFSTEIQCSPSSIEALEYSSS